MSPAPYSLIRPSEWSPRLLRRPSRGGCRACSASLTARARTLCPFSCARMRSQQHEQGLSRMLGVCLPFASMKHSDAGSQISCHRRRPPQRSSRSSHSSQSRMEISCHRRRLPLRSSRSSYSSQSSSRSRSRSRSSSIPRSMLTDGVSLTAAAISSVLTRLQLPGGGPNISSSIRCSS